MGRRPDYSLDNTADCRSISAKFLKENGYFQRPSGGTIRWLQNDEVTSSISVRTYYKGLSERINTLQLTYTINPKDEELATKMDYEIPVATTKCNYGGYRYWFKCPLYKKGTYCGRKVTKLYQLPNSNYFGCRHCGGLRYESQRTKPQVGFRAVYSFYTLDDMEDSIKKWSYKGKPTKKANRYYQLLTRAHMQLRFL